LLTQQFKRHQRFLGWQVHRPATKGVMGYFTGRRAISASITAQGFALLRRVRFGVVKEYFGHGKLDT
jgi:hypothetical protein